MCDSRHAGPLQVLPYLHLALVCHRVLSSHTLFGGLAHGMLMEIIECTIPYLGQLGHMRLTYGRWVTRIVGAIPLHSPAGGLHGLRSLMLLLVLLESSLMIIGFKRNQAAQMTRPTGHEAVPTAGNAAVDITNLIMAKHRVASICVTMCKRLASLTADPVFAFAAEIKDWYQVRNFNDVSEKRSC